MCSLQGGTVKLLSKGLFAENQKHFLNSELTTILRQRPDYYRSLCERLKLTEDESAVLLERVKAYLSLADRGTLKAQSDIEALERTIRVVFVAFERSNLEQNPVLRRHLHSEDAFALIKALAEHRALEPN